MRGDYLEASPRYELGDCGQRGITSANAMRKVRDD